MVLAEFWISEKMEYHEKFHLKDYKTHLNSTGRGKGLAIFHKNDYNHLSNHNEENINITKIESEVLDVIAVYRSKDGFVDKLTSILQDFINFSKSSLIIGDVNICNMKMPQNELKTFLVGRKFKQIIRLATHIGGGHLNHAYILNTGGFEALPDVEIIPKYFSDHDAICITWRKVDSQSTTEESIDQN